MALCGATWQYIYQGNHSFHTNYFRGPRYSQASRSSHVRSEKTHIVKSPCTYFPAESFMRKWCPRQGPLFSISARRLWPFVQLHLVPCKVRTRQRWAMIRSPSDYLVLYIGLFTARVPHHTFIVNACGSSRDPSPKTKRSNCGSSEAGFHQLLPGVDAPLRPHLPIVFL